MTHVDYRLAGLLAVPFVLVFLAGLAAGVVAVFLICNLALLKRTWDQGRSISFVLSAALSLSVLVFLGSALSGLILMNGVFGQQAYVPENYPLFLLRPALEFFLVMLAAFAAALASFGALRHGSELVQRLIVPGVFLLVFVIALSLTKAWSSYWILADRFDTDAFVAALFEMARAEMSGVTAAFAGLGQAATGAGGGLFGEFFRALGSQADAVWEMVRAAGGNQFVLVETFPEIFAVSSLLALLYMVLRWPFTAFAAPE